MFSRITSFQIKQKLYFSFRLHLLGYQMILLAGLKLKFSKVEQLKPEQLHKH